MLRKLRAPRFNNALPQELKSGYATQGILDHLFGGRNDSGFGVTAVVGTGCHGSDRLPVLVGGIPQRLVLILDYQQLDALRLVRQQARKELLVEARKHRATKLLRQIPGIGPLRAAHLVAVMQTPPRFRTKRQLWTYSGLGLETHDSAQYRVVERQLPRSNQPVTLRGLNTNHNHDLKDIFKGAAMRASTAAGPLHDFYEALLAKGRKPTMARLTLARKIAAITLIVWKKEVRFEANYLKPQAA